MLDKIRAAVAHIRSHGAHQAKIGLVLGSGWGDFTDLLEEKVVLPYQQIPHFLGTTVLGHEGKMVLGRFKGTEIIVLQGRIHAYEGHSMGDVVFPIRVLGSLGIKTIILTNAAGGINKQFSQGDLVLIKDHINLSGNNPLIGPNLAELGGRFPDMTFAYHPLLLQLFKDKAAQLGLNVQEGIYSYLLGPTYETPAEIRMLRILGADMVGMSTVPETITAVHMNVNVVGISCITNMGAGMDNKALKHEDIQQAAKVALMKFSSLLGACLNEMVKMV